MPASCKQRERILAAGAADVPALPLGAVRGRLCFRCFEACENIMKCAGCRRAGYCSQVCQKLDWSAVHKKQCKILQRINEEDLNDYSSSREWAEYRRCLIKYGHLVQGLTQLRDTVFIIQAQPYCSKCYRSANQLLSRDISLKSCRDCHLSHHCSDCSNPHSKTVCAIFQNQNKIEHFRHQYFEDSGKASVIACTATPRSAFNSLAQCDGWYDYFINVSDKAFIKGRIERDFTRITASAVKDGAGRQEFEESRRMFLLLGTDTLTMPLTVAAALEDLQLVATPDLKIHMLGATGREFLAMSAFEELLHLIPSLKTLDIAAIGPSSQLFGQGPEGYAPKVNLPCCEACQTQDRKRLLSAYKGLYHDFAESSFYAKPDLIVAFNSGCVDGDDADSDWDKTIRLIVGSNVPALFTTYNAREALHEQAKMKSLGAKFIVEPEMNKWSGLVPMPEFLDVENDIFYQNFHRYILKGKQK